jgi:hypothetical protein
MKVRLFNYYLISFVEGIKLTYYDNRDGTHKNRHRRSIDKGEVATLIRKMPRHFVIACTLILATLALINFCSADDFNGTVYRLNLSYVEVTEPVNSASYNLTLQQKAENFTLLDSSGKSVPINISETFWGGDHKYALSFERNVTGVLIYSYRSPSPQQFIVPLKGKKSVRIMLPPGYTTGDRLLGIANPQPDEVQASEEGRILTWYNTSGHLLIELNYYQENAPKMVIKIFLALLVIAAGILLEYYVSIRRLRAVRDDMEEKAKSP